MSEDPIYFSLKDLGIILLLSALAAASGALVPSWLFPEGVLSSFLYGTLGLPGPGAGVFVFGSILCFWLLCGLILVQKPGTAAAMAVILMAIDLTIGNQLILVQTLDAFLFVALVIEVMALIPEDYQFSRSVLPACLAVLGIFTLAIVLAGLAKQGEADTAVTGFPAALFLFGIAALCCAFIAYRYPVALFPAAGLATMYYMLHFWIFWGDGFAARFPPDPAMIPVLLLIALLGGFLAAVAAGGIGWLFWRLQGHSGHPSDKDQ